MGASVARRLGWLLVPLGVVAWMAAPEWPARVAMMNSPWRDGWLPIASAWAQTHPVPIRPVPTRAAVPTSPPGTNASMRASLAAAPNAPTPSPEAAAAGPLPATASASAGDEPTPHPLGAAAPTGGVVLMVGDSLMGEVAAGLRQHLPRTFTVVDDHKSSTGLTNLGYYDWPSTAFQEAQAARPQWVVIHLGANDSQDMLLNGRAVRAGSDAWQSAYRERAMLLIDRIKEAAPNATIVWIGLPAMRSDAFDARMDIIRRLQQQAAAARGVTYLDGRTALGRTYTKDGDVGGGKRLIWRADDGIHYSRAGGTRLAREAADSPLLEFPWKAP